MNRMARKMFFRSMSLTIFIGAIIIAISVAIITSRVNAVTETKTETNRATTTTKLYPVVAFGSTTEAFTTMPTTIQATTTTTTTTEVSTTMPTTTTSTKASTTMPTTIQTTKTTTTTTTEASTTMPTTTQITTTELSTTEVSTTMPTTTETTTESTTEITKDSTTEPDISQSELEMLAHLIYGESGNQDDETQRAVGSVVMNRVAHKRYPNSIKEVIFDKGQYACTWDGNYDKKPSQQAYDNARWILEGNRQLSKDYVYQAGFKQGYNCVKVGSEWFGTYSP